jgi:hypothetical protein
MNWSSFNVRYEAKKLLRRMKRNSLPRVSVRGVATTIITSFLVIICGAWLALTDSRLVPAGKDGAGQFSIDTTIVSSAGDTVRFFMTPSYSVKNRRFKSGHISRCEVYPIALQFSPPASATVHSIRVPPFRTRRVTCEMHFSLLLGKAYPSPEWQLALFADDGTEVLRRTLTMPLPQGCKKMEISPSSLESGKTMGVFCEEPDSVRKARPTSVQLKVLEVDVARPRAPLKVPPITVFVRNAGTASASEITQSSLLTFAAGELKDSSLVAAQDYLLSQVRTWYAAAANPPDQPLVPGANVEIPIPSSQSIDQAAFLGNLTGVSEGRFVLYVLVGARYFDVGTGHYYVFEACFGFSGRDLHQRACGRNQTVQLESRREKGADTIPQIR